MFCRKCGKALVDDSSFCSYCGEKVVFVNNEGHIVNDKNMPKWDLSGFPKISTEPVERKKYKSIKVDWNVFDEDMQKNKLNLESNSTSELVEENDNLLQNIEELKHKKIFDLFEEKEEQDEINKEESQLPQVLSDEQEQEQKNKKNGYKDDIVQKVLFESKLSELEKKNKESETEKLHEELEQKKQKEVSIEDERNNTDVEHQIDKFYTFSQKNEEFQKLLDREYERIKSQEPSNENKTINLKSQVEKDDFFELEEKNFDDFLEEMKLEEDVHKPIKDTSRGDTKTFVRTSSVTKSTEKALETKNQSLESEIENLEIEKKDRLEENEIAKEFHEQEIDNDEENKLENLTVEDLNSREAMIFENEENKISIVNVFIFIIVLGILIEAGILGITYFFPESRVALEINEQIDKSERFIENLFGKDGEDEKQSEDNNGGTVRNDNNVAENEVKDNQNSQPETPEEELMNTLKAMNTNIEEIKLNGTLKYDSNKDYGVLGSLDNTETIGEDVWKQYENGQRITYKTALAETLVEFNSNWVNYVNNGDRKVFDYIKIDSPMYRDVINFSKAGKVKETFESLEIGEIRKNDKGFYVWTQEKTKWQGTGVAETKSDLWVYYLEELDGQFKMVTYTKVK